MFFYWWLSFLQEFYGVTSTGEAPRVADMPPTTAAATPTPSADPSRERILAEALAKTQAALHASEERSATFLSSMSHELRTPLNAIMGFADMMRNGVFGPLENPTYLQYAQHIHDSGAQLLTKIDDLLSLACMHAEEHELNESHFSVQELLAELLVAHADAAFTHGVAFKLDAPGAIEINADREQLLCALSHFTANSLRHCAKGSEILISARIQPDEGLILSVRDGGKGIPTEQLAAIRESLQQQSSYFAIQGNGIGLGLSLAHELAKRHGGRIMIDSLRHRGTVVSLILPASRIVSGMPQKRRGNRANPPRVPQLSLH